MWFLDKRHEFLLDGRRLEIIIKHNASKSIRSINQFSQENFKKDILEITESAWKNSKIGKSISVTRIIFSTSSSIFSGGISAAVIHNEAKFGNIYIHAEKLLETFIVMKNKFRNYAEFLNVYSELLELEIAHLYQFQKNESLITRKMAGDKLNNIMRYLKTFDKNSPLPTLRYVLFNQLARFQIEGTSRYCSLILNNRLYPNKRNVIKSYENCQKFFKFLQSLENSADVLIKSPNKFDELLDELDIAVYDIGTHMTITIVYFSVMTNKKLTIEEILEMKVFRFIIYYEQSAQFVGLKPIITLNSGNGYFDYNRALAKLVEIYNKNR